MWHKNQLRTLRCQLASGYRLQEEIGKSEFLIYLFFFFLSPPATAYKIFPNRLKSCSPMQRLWKNFPWKKCFQSKKISPVPTPTGVSNDGVGRSDSHHENSQGIQFCNRCKRSTLFELQYDIRGQIFEVSQKSTVKS